MTTDEKRALIDRYLDAYNAFDVDGILDTLHPEVAFKNVADGEVTASASGTDEFRTMVEKAAEIFATRTQTITSATEREDGAVTIEVEYEGTLAQNLPGGLDAGEKIRLDGQSTFHFEDGKISAIIDES